MATLTNFEAKLNELVVTISEERGQVRAAIANLEAEVASLKNSIGSEPDYTAAISRVDEAIAAVKDIIAPPDPVPVPTIETPQEPTFIGFAGSAGVDPAVGEPQVVEQPVEPPAEVPPTQVPSAEDF